jgi:DNA polymerase III subunit delta'
MLAQVPRLDIARLYAFADQIARPEAEHTFRTTEELLLQFLARTVGHAARGRLAPEELVTGESDAMRPLAAHSDPARWAGLRDRIDRDFAATDQVNLDRKQAILGAFFAIEELAR